MSGRPSWVWIDWRLSGRSLSREWIVRWICLCVLAFALLVLLLSGGATRFLASRYAITAVLKPSVSRGDAEGLARKVAELPPVRSAVYRDPEAAWKEFLEAFPGLESLPSAGGNPLPGYIEIRIRRDRFALADVGAVVSVLRPLPHLEKVLAGEDTLPRLLRVDRYASIFCWGVFGAFVTALFLIFRLQERARAYAHARDFEFLLERGVSAGRMAASRAAGAALAGVLASAAGIGLAWAALHHLLRRFPVLENVIGPPGDLPLLRTAVAAGSFLLLTAFLAASASLLGWRAFRSRRT